MKGKIIKEVCIPDHVVIYLHGRRRQEVRKRIRKERTDESRWEWEGNETERKLL